MRTSETTDIYHTSIADYFRKSFGLRLSSPLWMMLFPLYSHFHFIVWLFSLGQSHVLTDDLPRILCHLFHICEHLKWSQYLDKGTSSVPQWLEYVFIRLFHYSCFTFQSYLFRLTLFRWCSLCLFFKTGHRWHRWF